MKNRLKSKISGWRRLVALIAALTLLFGLVAPETVMAAQITSRKVTVTNSNGGASGVSYTLSTAALPTTGTAIKSVDLQICDQASGTCTHSGSANGFSASSSTLHSQPTGLGAASGWSVDATSQYDLRVKDASNATNPSGSVSIQWDSVTNPTAANSTYFLRMTTYTGSDFSTGPTDTGVIALSTSQAITLDATVNETITFCTGTSGVTSSSCSGATGTTVNFGSLSASSATSGTSQIGVGTNAGSGYAITVNGSSLTCSSCSGSPSIATVASAAASNPGTEQFAMNLEANTTPSVGSNPAGSGSAVPSAGYNTANSFQYNTGDTIVSNGTSDQFRLFTASYIVNITTATKAGPYTTTLTYICTATF